MRVRPIGIAESGCPVADTGVLEGLQALLAP